MTSLHQPVLFAEVIEGLNLKNGSRVIDATIGGAGHSLGILEKISPQGKLLGIDRDRKAIALSRQSLTNYSNVTITPGRFSRLEELAKATGFESVEAILLDLGWSSNQLVDDTRGFSFKIDSPLDLRMDEELSLTAADVLNRSSDYELTDIFKKFGEVDRAKALAREIVKIRKINPFNRTGDLLSVISLLVRGQYKLPEVAAKVWQALRIYINQEFIELKMVLPQAIRLLTPQGRLAVITFHSGEDKIVKNYFKQEATTCICPPNWPVCQCHHQAQIKLINKKTITASDQEVQKNSRARSAKLRIIEKI